MTGPAASADSRGGLAGAVGSGSGLAFAVSGFGIGGGGRASGAGVGAVGAGGGLAAVAGAVSGGAASAAGGTGDGNGAGAGGGAAFAGTFVGLGRVGAACGTAAGVDRTASITRVLKRGSPGAARLNRAASRSKARWASTTTAPSTNPARQPGPCLVALPMRVFLACMRRLMMVAIPSAVRPTQRAMARFDHEISHLQRRLPRRPIAGGVA